MKILVKLVWCVLDLPIRSTNLHTERMYTPMYMHESQGDASHIRQYVAHDIEYLKNDWQNKDK